MMFWVHDVCIRSTSICVRKRSFSPSEFYFFDGGENGGGAPLLSLRRMFMTRFIATVLLGLFRHRRWQKLFYPAMLLVAGIFALGHDAAEQPRLAASATHEKICLDPVPSTQATIVLPDQRRDPRTLWEDAVTHPILALLFVMGLMHALEISQHLTLLLLRHLRSQIERIIDGAAKHNREFDEIFRSMLGRTDDENASGPPANPESEPEPQP
jgi:hypothetical protein